MEQLSSILTAFMRIPKTRDDLAELWYTDQDEVTSVKFSRALGAFGSRTSSAKRGDAVITTDRFPPNPSKFVCKVVPIRPVGQWALRRRCDE